MPFGCPVPVHVLRLVRVSGRITCSIRKADQYILIWDTWATLLALDNARTAATFLAMASVSAPPIPLRTVTLSDLQHEGRTYDMLLNVVNLVDKRPSQVSTPQEWLFQKQVEDVLFPESFQLKTNGAFYRASSSCSPTTVISAEDRRRESRVASSCSTLPCRDMRGSKANGATSCRGASGCVG